jgi:hypothetical protein
MSAIPVTVRRVGACEEESGGWSVREAAPGARKRAAVSSFVKKLLRKHESEESCEGARRRVAALAVLLDSAFVIPGTSVRVGLDPLVGLIPAAGDAISAAASLYIVYEGWRLGASRGQVAAMLGNVAIDALAGVVPGLGDVVDLAFKANMRNLAILGITPRVQAGK